MTEIYMQLDWHNISKHLMKRMASSGEREMEVLFFGNLATHMNIVSQDVEQKK